MMKYYRIFLFITLFCLLQLILLYINTSRVRKCLSSGITKPNEHKMEELRNVVKDDYTESLLKTIAKLESENSMLRQLMREHKITIKKRTAETTQSPQEKKSKIEKGTAKFEESITIILYRDYGTDELCIETRKANVLKHFPGTNILTSHSKTVGGAFNELFPKVETEYFYFLNAKHELVKENALHSVTVLLQDLENIPELDFIGSSILDKDKLEIPCYRLQLCNWTLSQRYEYKRSINETMVCENIASSFMGRTGSVKRIFSGQQQIFDEQLRKLSITDFFLRAKHAGAISGIRPEVMVKLSEGQKCTSSITEDKLNHYQALLPFAHKHKVFRFKDAESQSLDLCGEDSPLLGKDICDEAKAHKIMLKGSHWSYEGTFAYPYIIRNLQYCLFKMDDFFKSRGIHYWVDGGVAMGAIKMRAILPWDSGDVDVQVFHDNPSALYSILEAFAKQYDYTIKNRLHIDNQIQIFCAPGQGDKMGGLVSMFMNNEQYPTNVVKIKTHGRWIPYVPEIFKYMRRIYGKTYLQHKLHGTSDTMHCKTDHNACLPDFKKIGEKGGTYHEWFCDL